MNDSYALHYLHAVSHGNALAENLWAVRARLVECARLNGKATSDDADDVETHDYYMDLCDRAGIPRTT